MILAALVIGGGPQARPVTLGDLLLEADFMHRWLPSFEEVAFGLPRLVAGGFVSVVPSDTGMPSFKPLPAASGLLHVPRRTGEFADDVVIALRTRPYPDPEVEDRSLGRLAGLDESQFNREVETRQAWQEKVSPRGWALFESTRAEQLAAHGEPVSNWKGRPRRNRGAQGREAQ